MYDFNKHFDTYQRQREDMLPIDPEYISIIACTMRPEFINNIFANYNRQSYKNKELIIILNHDDIDIDKVKIKAMLYTFVQKYCGGAAWLMQLVTIGFGSRNDLF